MTSLVASNLKRIIKESGYKQSAVAQKAGFAPEKFNNMLNGRKIIADTDILPICSALSIAPNDLFSFNPHPPKGSDSPPPHPQKKA